MVDTKKCTGLIDLDAMLHIVANVQFSAGNRENIKQTKSRVFTFINTIKKNAKCKDYISLYQNMNHTNFRNEILPEYKSHRTTSEAIKTWKSTIIEAFNESNAIGVDFIETDDAISIISNQLNKENCVIISSDKDMAQIEGFHYNPFKQGTTLDPTRWYYSSFSNAEKFFWAQVLAGDATDMPNAFCGIPGVGVPTALKLLDKFPKSTPYFKRVQEIYTNKFKNITPKEVLERALITYKMVRLLDGTEKDAYVNENARKEIDKIKQSYQSYKITENENRNVQLFGVEPLVNLFKQS